MGDLINNYSDVITASNNLKIIASELSSVSYHLKKLNEDMKLAIKGTAGEYFTNKIVPLGIRKSDELSEKSEALSNRLNLITKTMNELESNIEGADIDFL